MQEKEKSSEDLSVNEELLEEGEPNKLAFILLHLGENDYKSRTILNKIKDIKIITKIKINSNSVKQWLRCNTRGLVINSFPVFLIAEENSGTRVYHYEIIDEAIEIVENLLIS